MIVEALTGWLGLLSLVLAAGCALAIDVLRQRLGGSGEAPPHRRAWVTWLTVAAAELAVLAAVATVLRFATLP